MNKNIVKIVCPHCGYEYLPAEIFYPTSVFDDPGTIVRNEKGKIEFFSGKNIELIESFVCDKCGCEFEVEGKVEFNTQLKVRDIFSEEYFSDIK